MSVLEDVKDIKIDSWKTLNTAASPTKLEPGQAANMQDVWVDEKPGSVITANGLLAVGSIPSGNPPTFCINYFKTSSGTQTFVVSDNATVWTTTDFQTFTSIITGLSSSFQLRGLVVRDKLWLTNGTDSVRVFDGAVVTVLDGTAGTPSVPKGRYISYTDERVWIYHTSGNRSGLYFAALADSSGTAIAPDNANAWPAANVLQISEGDADFGTGLILYRGYLHAFKQYSIYRIVGYDEYTYTRVKTRASTGTRFSESIQILDNLVHLLGTDGIYVFDGEDAERVSDIIDPASSSQAAFGFDQIGQPNTNNLFWQTEDTADWNLGTVPTNITVNESISLEAADDSQADFAAGATLTNVTTSEIAGSVRLSRSSAGVANDNIAINQPSVLTVNEIVSTIGASAYVTDGGFSNSVGFAGAPSNDFLAYGNIALSLPAVNFKTVVLKSLSTNGVSFVSFRDSGGSTIAISTVNGVAPAGGIMTVIGGPTDYTVVLAVTNTPTLNIRFGAQNKVVTLTEIQVFGTAFNTTGKFTSKTLDLGAIPNSLGNFNAEATIPSTTGLTYFTQSSADGISWDAEVACTDAGAITSTVRRYLRWGANFTSTGTETPEITSAWLPAQYISVIHDTAGSIFAWGPVESEYALSGQTVNFYYRTGTTSPNCSAAGWNLIVPGGAISAAVSQQFVQFKIEILGGDDTHIPMITSVTVNWVTGTASQPPTLQNVASAVWKNRYYLSFTGAGASSNNTVLVRGKKTFGWPWMLKQWSILSFTRFYDSLYGGHSGSAAIFKLDTGFSRNGGTMDSFFETGDYTFGGFYINLLEVLVEVERMGPYNLSVGVSTDRGATYTERNVDLTTSSYAPSYIKKLNFNLISDRIRFRVRISGADQPYQVHNLRAFYRLSEARGSIQ